MEVNGNEMSLLGSQKLQELPMYQPYYESCDGTNYDSECCSVAVPCAINEGDCDKESECQGNLICGSNNCPAPFPSEADCCESPFGKEYHGFN